MLVEPLPFEPVTWIVGVPLCGSPMRLSKDFIEGRPMVGPRAPKVALSISGNACRNASASS